MPQRIALPLNRPVLVLLALLAVVGGLVLAFGHGTSSNAGVLHCTNPDQWSEITDDYDPVSGAPGAPLTVSMLNTGQGPQNVAEHMEAYLGADPPGFFPDDRRIGETDIPAGQMSAVIQGTVPDLPPGDYEIILCWEHGVLAPGWRYDTVGRFTVEPTPIPTASPTPSPTQSTRVTDSPTPTPTATPTPTPTPSPSPTNSPAPTIKPFKFFPYNPPLLLDYFFPWFPTEDLSIFGIEITEAIQCFDTSKGLGGCSNNSLPVVTQKNAAARIYLKYVGAGTSKAGVPVRLHLFANNVEYIVNTSGTAQSTLNQLLNTNANVWFNMNFTNDITLTYYAEVDPNNVYAETNESNNRFPASGTSAIVFHKRRTFDVMGWRMRYHPSGFSGNQYAGGWAVNSGGANWLNDVWPVKEAGIDYSLHSGYLDWTSNIGSGGESAVVNLIKAYQILEMVWPWFDPQILGKERIHVWTPNSHFVRGLSDPPWAPGLGVASVGDDSPGSAMTMDAPGFGVVNFVHEVSHNSGMRHTSTGIGCDDSGGSTDWPYSNPKIQEVGYNPDTGKVYDPASSYDFMSYCYGSSYTSWISPFHWNQQYTTEGASGSRLATSSVDDDVLSIIATLDNPDLNGDQGGSFGTLYKTNGGGNVVDPPPGDNYSAELRDGDTVLATHPFGVSFEPIEGEEPFADNLAAFSVPWVDGTTSVALLRGAEVLDEVAVSSNPPTIVVTDPASPEVWAAGTTETVAWEGNDSDGDTLKYSLYFSYDGGETFQILAIDLTATSYGVDVDSIAGGDDVVFRVVASDGVNTGFGDSATVTVPNKPPLVDTSGPEDGTLVASGGLVVFSGAATDLEDGAIPDEGLVWSSDIDGELGSGESLPFNELSPGVHLITLTATDSDEAEATASITVIIGVQARVAVVPGAVDPDTDDNVLVVVTLDPGTPTEDINEGTLRIKIGDADLDPLSSHQLGDTNQDGLPELLLVLEGAAVRDAVPEPGLLTEALLTGEMDDGGVLQGVGQLAIIVPGDLNCDGVRDGEDVFDGLSFVANLGAPDCTFAADFDCSGDLTTGDLLGLLGRLAGTSVVSVGCPEEPAPAALTAAGEDNGSPGGLARILTWSWPALLLVLPALVAVKPWRQQ